MRLKISLSSAASMDSGEVPIIFTPFSFSSLAKFNGVCPPN